MTTWQDIVDAYDSLCPEITVLVEAGRVEELQAAVDAADLPARVTVMSSPYVPAGQVLIVNESEARRVVCEATGWSMQGGEER